MTKLSLSLGLFSSAAIALMVVSAAPPAYALGDCVGNQNCTDDHSNTATGGAGGAGGAGGNSTNTNVNTATGGNVDRPGNSLNVNDNDQRIHNSNRSSNRNSNRQGQGQFQVQDQDQRQQINYQRNTPPAYAPTDYISTEVCAKGQSAGATGPAFGISIGITDSDDQCNLRRNSATARALYETTKDPRFIVVAFEVMCVNDDWREAAKMAGFPCAADRPAEQVSEAPSAPTPQRVAVTMEPIANE